MNNYTYCNNNPLVYDDPTGHWPKFLDDVASWVSKKASDVVDSVKSAVSTTVTEVKSVVSTVSKVVDSGINYVKREASSIGSAIGSKSNSIVSSLKSKSNPINKSLDSFKQIGSDFKNGLKQRADNALNSPSDFANFLTVGMSGGIYSGLVDRADRVTNSPYDFANWASNGIAGMIKGTVAPEDSFSKEHWLNSFGMATLFSGGVKASAIERADAINSGTIIKTSYVKSIDFLKLGTGNVGDFSNLKGSTIDEVLSRMPKDAIKRELTPIEGKVQEGFEYKWSQDGQTWRARVHGPDASAPIDSNAFNSWVTRIQKGKQYMDDTGRFHPPGISNPNSEFYDEQLINDTHISIISPN